MVLCSLITFKFSYLADAYSMQHSNEEKYKQFIKTQLTTLAVMQCQILIFNQ